MRLYHHDQEDKGQKNLRLLSKNSLLSDYENIQNDSILYIIYRKQGMENDVDSDEFGELDNVWEDVNEVVEKTLEFGLAEGDDDE